MIRSKERHRDTRWSRLRETKHGSKSKGARSGYTYQYIEGARIKQTQALPCKIRWWWRQSAGRRSTRGVLCSPVGKVHGIGEPTLHRHRDYLSLTSILSTGPLEWDGLRRGMYHGRRKGMARGVYDKVE